MQPPMLDDGREQLTLPGLDATCKATEDKDYYWYFVTFEVKEKS